MRFPAVQRASGAPGASPPAAGFTLAELIVVLAMIALVASILLPSLGQAVELAYATHCRNNLHHLAEAMHGGSTRSPLAVPSGAAWTSHAIAYGSRELLFCKKDDEDRTTSAASLEDYYLLQSHGSGGSWWVSNVAAILDMGDGVIQDPQIHYKDIPQKPVVHHGNHPCWCNIPVRRANQHLIAITDEAMILITFEPNRITIESVVGCGVTHCASDHWLMRGHCTDGRRCLAEDDIIMQLGGDHYRTVDPRSPHVINTETASYGINGLIEPKRFSPQQLMLMDANDLVLSVGQPGWMDHIQPRHLGRVNVVTVGGSARTMTLAELRDEYLLLQEEGPGSRSLWNHQACPRP
jgi:prepilin-type N-terminal cleavage/methylation domain-containing protein